VKQDKNAGNSGDAVKVPLYEAAREAMVDPSVKRVEIFDSHGGAGCYLGKPRDAFSDFPERDAYREAQDNALTAIEPAIRIAGERPSLVGLGPLLGRAAGKKLGLYSGAERDAASTARLIYTLDSLELQPKAAVNSPSADGFDSVLQATAVPAVGAFRIVFLDPFSWQDAYELDAGARIVEQVVAGGNAVIGIFNPGTEAQKGRRLDWKRSRDRFVAAAGKWGRAEFLLKDQFGRDTPRDGRVLHHGMLLLSDRAPALAAARRHWASRVLQSKRFRGWTSVER
jgi:hypothetical protein